MVPFGRPLRREWLLEEGMAFLNHGSFGATPRRVMRAADRWRTELERQPLRFFMDRYPCALRAAADDLAAFLGARGDDLAFVENASAGVNAVLRSLDLRAGDEVLTTDHVYGAVGKTLDYVCRRAGAQAVRVPLPFPCPGPESVLSALAAGFSARTRLVVLDHITSPTALVLPVREAVDLCHARGVPILVDGAHGPGMLDLDLPALGPDWYTGNCHKWLFAAKGCALLWANPTRPDARRDLHPPVISHYLDLPFPAEFDWVGTRDAAAWLSVTEALAFVRELGPERIRAHNRRLVDEGAALLCEAWGVAASAPPSMRGSMATLPCPFPGEPTPDGAFALNRRIWAEHRIECMPLAFGGRLWIRVTAQIYNEIDEYQRLADALRGAAAA
jgi:isopenicillin-N epimerase